MPGHQGAIGGPRHSESGSLMKRLSQKLFSWASICDDATMEQALRTSTMPFIYPHMALMSDCHLGKGATVGSVIPTLGAIMPAAVGVDIGCFHGDTRVPLLNGRQSTLRELADGAGPYWVYSVDENGQVVPGRAVALRTRDDAELVKVIVSGGEEIICTPDHLFMLNDGSYREARDLRFNDSLMPLYRRWQTRDGNCSTDAQPCVRGAPRPGPRRLRGPPP
jgi:tRNA-splicing ligase RtcB (3'-phosphate/5'-hydroxy nucleic acid ligase)